MATNLTIDQKLLIEAQKLGGYKTKKETVNQALKEYIQRRKQTEILHLFNKIDYYKDYNYKDLRYRMSRVMLIPQ